MSDVFHLSDALSTELVMASPDAEKQRIQTWTALDTAIQTLLADQPTLESVLHDELKTRFPEATGSLDPERLLVVVTPTSPPLSTLSPQPLSVIDTVLETFRTGVYPRYPKERTTVARDDEAATGSLDIARFETFAADVRQHLRTYVKQQTTEFWSAQTSVTGTLSRKAWLLGKLSELVVAESHLLSYDSTLTPEHRVMIDQVVRYPTLTARGALPAYSRPAVYALSIKTLEDPALADLTGAFVITERDGTGANDEAGAFSIPAKTATVQIGSSTDAARVVLYTPSGGLLGFESLQALHTEIERRWRSVSEFESMLELLSTQDLKRVVTWDNSPQAALDMVFTEIQGSVFEHVFNAHDTQREQNLFHALLNAAQRSPTDIKEAVAHVLDYTHRFKQAKALNARSVKRLAKKARDWLLKASSIDRQTWLQVSEQYRLLSLIAHENGEPSPDQFGDRPFLLRYAREQLQQHIFAEYGLEVDPDTVLITVTSAERGSGPVIPLTGWAPSSYTAANSLSRTGPTIKLSSTTRTMTELALENVSKFDIDYALTARVTTLSNDDPAAAPLDAGQVKTIIRAVNIGDSYAAFLQDALIDSPKAQARRETAMRVMSARMLADALEAKISGDFSPDRVDRGYRWVETAVNAAQDPTHAGTFEGHLIQTYQLLISGATVRGVLIFGTPADQQRANSQMELDINAPQPQFAVRSLVVYTPEAPDGKRFREFENRQHFAKHFLGNPQLLDYFVGRVSQGNQERIRPLLARGLRAPEVNILPVAGNFIEQACLADARHALANADALSTSTSEINQLTVWNSIETAVDVVTMLLPLKVTAPIALGRSLMSLWNFIDALKRDSQREAIGHWVSMIAHWVDAGIDVGVGIVRGVKKPATPAPGLDPKLSYNQSLSDLTLRSDGIYEGVYEKAAAPRGTPQHFIKQDEHWFQVKYDAHLRTWRVMDMRHPQAWYRSPVERDSAGVWRVGSPQGGLRGGVRSTLAPLRVRVAFPNFSYREARRLLDQFEFPAASQQRLELDLAEYLVKHQEFPVWSRQYHKPGLGEAAPRAGTSTGTAGSSVGLSNKRKAPAVPEEQPVRPAKQPVISTTTASVEPLNNTSWRRWGETFEDAQLKPESINPPISTVTDARGTHRVIKIDDLYYQILPQGNLAQGKRVFIKYPDKPCNTYEQLGLRIHESPFLQPRLAEYISGSWIVFPPFFQKTLAQFIGSLMPALTPVSRSALAKRLYVTADASSPDLTPTRMSNINNTLHGWRSGNAVPDNIHLGDPLALLAQGTGIGNKTFTMGQLARRAFFNQLDLVLLASERLLLTEPLGLNKMMRGLLERLGFEIYPDVTSATELVFRRKGASTLNYLQLHRVDTPQISLAKPLTESVDDFIRRNPLSPLSMALKTAKQEGKLLTFLGGVQVSPLSDVPTGFIYRA
ncbi:dermonecrotic toxin domain-containing protein [Pseudomonas lundensis]|uniref:dermonecrotic toxin domain-containing protein n=1 Tax=Pseudomonas lundensis TaxID=86185 RepID=UPI0040454563